MSDFEFEDFQFYHFVLILTFIFLVWMLFIDKFHYKFEFLTFGGPPSIVRERVVSPGAQTRRAHKKFTGGSQALHVHNSD